MSLRPGLSNVTDQVIEHSSRLEGLLFSRYHGALDLRDTNTFWRKTHVPYSGGLFAPCPRAVSSLRKTRCARWRAELRP